MPSPIPDLPALPEGQRATGKYALRYEDISQDGRLILESAMPGLGAGVWRPLVSNTAFAAAAAHGILPILSRLVIVGGEGPVGVGGSLTADGAYALAHTRTKEGEVDRILVNMWCDLSGRRGRTNGPPPPDAGSPVRVARVFAEHVVTRPFAPREERKVRRMDLPGLPAVPRDEVIALDPASLLHPPDDGTPLDDGPVADTVPLVFGLRHTDSNQHVNSLVYPRAFEEAALRRLAAHGQPTALLARTLEIVWRKPFFAGERAILSLRAFALPGGFAATGTFSLAAAEGRPHAYIRMTFAA